MIAESLSTLETEHYPLAHGYLFQESGVSRAIDAKTAIEWLQTRTDGEKEFVWLHFHDPSSVLYGWPMQLLDLPASFVDTLKEGPRSTRIAHDHQNLIAVINDVDYDLSRKRPLTVATLWLNAGVRCLLSVHTLGLRSVDQLRGEINAGKPFYSPMALLIHLLQEQADVLSGIARSAAQTSNQVEEVLLSNQLPTRSSLGGIRRDLVRLRRLLAPEPGAMFRLVNRPPHWMRYEDVQSLRLSAEEFSPTIRDIAGLQERIQLLEEEIADRVGEHTIRNVLILTAVTVIALPINLMSGLFGMNIGGIPFRYDNRGFLLVLLLSALLTSLSAWLIFRLWRD